MCRRLGAAHTAGRPSTTVPCRDACARMPALPIPAPLTLRASNLSFLSTHTKHEKRSGAVSEVPARPGPTSPRSRCPAPGPPAPADRPAPAKVIISGRSGRGRKKRVEKRSRLAPLDKVYVAKRKENSTFIYKMTRRRPVADTASGVGPNYISNLCPPTLSKHLL